MNITIIGAGRAGSSFATALRSVGHDVRLIHHGELDYVGEPQLILLSVPDDAISSVSDQLVSNDSYVVAHVAGSRGLGELAKHRRVGLMHPLAALPTPELGAPRLLSALYSAAGAELGTGGVASVGGRAIHLSDEQRAAYHPTASVAANHLVALMGHVQVLAESAGLDRKSTRLN